MSTLSVTKFASAGGAQQALEVLQGLQPQQLLTIQDAAIVSWPEGASAPKTSNMNNLTGAGAVGGAFWGMLFGLIFFMPLFGAAIGAISGAISGHFADFGISKDFIDQVRGKVTPGTSALFLLTTNAVPERIGEALREAGIEGELISTNLSSEQEAKLKSELGLTA